MKTIAQQIKWNFQANGNLLIKGKNGKLIYWENSNGDWGKSEYDSKGNGIYYEDSYGNWVKSEYDSKGNEIYFENSHGQWIKREYDSQGNRIYYEDSPHGIIIDSRPKPCENKEIEIEGIKYKLVKA